jgi:Arc/MetJ family transcription regulator
VNTRTNIVLDDELVAKAMARAGVKTKKAAVEAALRAYVRKPDYSGLLALEGSRLISDDYDPKALFTHPRHSTGLVASEPEPAQYKAVNTVRRKRTPIRK